MEHLLKTIDFPVCFKYYGIPEEKSRWNDDAMKIQTRLVRICDSRTRRA